MKKVIVALMIVLLSWGCSFADTYEYSVPAADGSYTFKAGNKGEVHHELTFMFSGGTPTSGTISVSAKPSNSSSVFAVPQGQKIDLTNLPFISFEGDVEEYTFTTVGVTGVSSIKVSDVASTSSVSTNWYGPTEIATLVKNSEFMLAVQMGLVPGFSAVDKFGENPEIDIDSFPEDIWEFGGTYNYDSVGTEPIAYLSSSSPADQLQTISIQGLDKDGEMVTQNAITNGQTNVLLDTPLWRVFRMTNMSPDGGSISGTVYCHTDPVPVGGVPADANVRAIIDDGNNQTLMTLYTVPLGKVGFLFRGEVGASRAQASGATRSAYLSRRFGGIFTVKKRVDTTNSGNSFYQDDRVFPDIIPALTDIKLTVEEVTANNTGVFGTFDLLLVDEDKFTDSYLQSIGQPGY